MCSLKQNDIINENRYEEAQDMIQEQQKYADDYCGVPAPQSDKEVMKRILIQVPYLPEPKMDKIIKIFDELNKIVPLDIEYYPDSKIPDFDFTPTSDKMDQPKKITPKEKWFWIGIGIGVTSATLVWAILFW